MFKVCDLFSVLSELNVLEILYFLLSENEFAFALLVGEGKFLLEMFHLLYEDFFVFESLFENEVLLFLSFEVEFE